MTKADQSIRHFHTKVAGISHRNPDGTSRQVIARRCARLEQLNLVHDSDNPHDPNAVQVLRTTGEQLGFLPAHVAAQVAAGNAAGVRYGVYVSAITGGRRGAATTGVNLLVVAAERGVSEADVVKYINRNIDEVSAHLPGRTGCATGAAAMIAIAAALALF